MRQGNSLKPPLVPPQVSIGIHTTNVININVEPQLSFEWRLVEANGYLCGHLKPFDSSLHG